MKDKVRFLYVPEKLKGQSLCFDKMNSINCPSDEKVHQMLSEISKNSAFPYVDLTDREIAELVLWADENNSLDNKFESIVHKRNNPLLQKYMYKLWQNRFDSEPLKELEMNIIQQFTLENEWQEYWNNFMTSSAAYIAAAGTAAWYCKQYDISLEELRKRFCISRCSDLWKKMSAVFYCFCDREYFICSDAELCEHIMVMTQEECYKLMQNMLRCFPLFSRSGKLFNDHEVYVSQYRKSMMLILKKIPDAPYSLLIRNYLAASEIPVEEHRYYWECLFLVSRSVSERMKNFTYLHDNSQKRFIMYSGDVIIVDDYNNNTFYRLPYENYVSLEMPYDLEKVCPPNDIYIGDHWKHMISNMNFNTSENSGGWKGRKSMENIKIDKLEVHYSVNGRTNRMIVENPEGISDFCLPEFDSNSKMIFTTDDSNERVITFGTFKNIMSGKIDDLTKFERDETAFLMDGNNQNYNFSFYTEKPLDKPPYLVVSDVTEKMLLDFPELSMEILDGKDAGIWGDCGNRLLMFYLNPAPLHDCDIVCSVAVKRVGNSEIDYPVKYFDTVILLKKEPRKFLCTLDTQAIQRDIDNDTRVSLESEFIIKCSYNSGPVKNEEYHFPFSLFVNNTVYDDELNKITCLDKLSRVSIDFGTSSTCVAVSEGGIRMIEMSPDVLGSEASNVYENPTNLMIYRYDLLRNEWRKPLIHNPLLRKAETSEIFADFSAEVFDYGHRVKNDYSGNKRTIESIISNLKMLPKDEHDGKETICIPYNIPENTDRVVRLTSGKEINANDFNPIKFYGYLLGKAINHPNGETNKYYTRYILSFPVKFDPDIKENIKSSLMEGLLLSLPKDIANKKDKKGNSLFRVDMSYSEPVACIGAACGYELKFDEDNSPKLFAIFDLGGGTLDFSFGMYRKGDIDEEGYDEVIELFGTDGEDSIGGEKLIRKIAYWIFSDKDGNLEVLLNNHIIFEKPDDEQIPDGYNGLIQSTPTAKAYMKQVCEKFARPFFEGKKVKTAEGNEWDPMNEDDKEKDSIEFELNLIDSNGEESTDRINLKANLSIINDKLGNEFKNICGIFEKAAENTFNSAYAQDKMSEFGVSYNKEKISVIMTGNASQHPMVRKNLYEMFSEDNVSLIGESEERGSGNIGGHYRVTPKTAVAIGQLKLADKLVVQPTINDKGDVFRYYVAIEKGNNSEIIINKHNDKQWKRVGVFTDGFIKIFYNGIANIENLHTWKYTNLVYEEEERMVCWIRSKGTHELEYIAVPIGKNNDPNSDQLLIDEIFTEELK